MQSKYRDIHEVGITWVNWTEYLGYVLEIKEIIVFIRILKPSEN